MKGDQVMFSIAKMKEYGIVDSGDAQTRGIGVMTDARVKSFYNKIVAAGVVAAGLDYRKSFTLKFIGHGVGLDLRPQP
jgi:NitT/TauT family transport system substrate-binding protein